MTADTQAQGDLIQAFDRLLRAVEMDGGLRDAAAQARTALAAALQGRAQEGEPSDERAAFEAWFLAEKKKTFPSDYEPWRLERWGEGYRHSYEKAWFGRAALAQAQKERNHG